MVSDQQDLVRRVTAVLQQFRNPRSGVDVLASRQVRELNADPEGGVSFQVVLGAGDEGGLVRALRSAVQAVEGVSQVKVDVKLPEAGMPAPPRAATGCGAAGSHSVEAPVPVPVTDLLPDVAHVVAVTSGKGGVGKSTVAANLAVALTMAGYRVGLLDADIHGPNIPRMFGERRKPRVTGQPGAEKIVPLEAHGVKLMSLGFLLDDDQPAIMRGPLITGILRQFLGQVDWQQLDILLVDMPPGTGDAQLSLVQTIKVDGAVMVTTPQEVATGDVRRAIRMFERVEARVLGVVENMSGLCCPHCKGDIELFGSGGGARLAEEMNVPLLGRVPIEPAIVKGGDAGTPEVLSAAASPAGEAFRQIAERLAQAVRLGGEA